uniref:LRRNT domain-containing protein n=1 Tax=Leptobrachium leishanense TaxID=445787 RepID=A0A8C5QUN7_9ANUR
LSNQHIQKPTPPASSMLSLLLVHLLFPPLYSNPSQNCPVSCLCYDSSNLVECRGKGLLTVPHQLPHSTWMLDLRHNNLTRLDSSSFQALWSLRILLLSDNNIEVQGAFRGLSRLRGYFFMLQNLELLDLSDNNISSIAVESFTSLHSLRLLALSENQLSHLKHLHIDDYDNLTCAGPPQLSGAALVSVDNQLCVAETATVLVITITVLVTVIAAIVMAERNRKKTQEKNWNDPDDVLSKYTSCHGCCPRSRE